MLSAATVAIAASLPIALAQSSSAENVVGVYMFHRHGDRTAKSTPPVDLTTLGYEEVYTSGQYYRDRYVQDNAALHVNGITPDLVKLSQIEASAPDDVVLQNSATGFLQGLYPPVGDSVDTETLGNGSKVAAPLNGYQLIPVDQVSTGAGSEDTTWLQSATGCAAADISSNNYFSSKQYLDLLASTKDFYQSLYPVVNATFSKDQLSFKNAYNIYDLIHVAEIHNASVQNNAILTPETLLQLRTLADAQQWGLAYNASDDMRAVAGMQLAGEIVDFLNSSITSQGKQKFGIQFGSYGTFASFFGLAQLPAASPDFYGIAEYASAMTFELFTNSSSVSGSNYPSTDELYVRFLWHNGTTTNASEPTVYPLFGSNQDALAWNDFASQMNKFAIASSKQWCTACGNFTGTCAAYAPESSTSSHASENCSNNANGLSATVNGVIGAMVTLAVVLGLETLIMVVGGYRIVNKKRLASDNVTGQTVTTKA